MVDYAGHGKQGTVYRQGNYAYKVFAIKRKDLYGNTVINREIEFTKFILQHPHATALIPMDLSKSRIFDLKNVDSEALDHNNQICYDIGKTILTPLTSLRAVFVYPYIDGGTLNQLIRDNRLTRAIRISAALQLLSTIQQYEKHYCHMDIHPGNIMWKRTSETMELLLNGKMQTIKTAGYRFYLIDYGTLTKPMVSYDSTTLVHYLFNTLNCVQMHLDNPIRIQPFVKFKHLLTVDVDKYMKMLPSPLPRSQKEAIREELQAALDWDTYVKVSGITATVTKLHSAGKITTTQLHRILTLNKDFTANETALAIVYVCKGVSHVISYIQKM